jgi:outer membrane protein assembly factor BamB
LVLVWGGLLWFRFLYRGQAHDAPQVDPELLQELQSASLPATGGPALTPGDWPQWRGPRRDGLSAEKFLTDWPRTGPKVLWKQPVGAGYSCVAVVGHRLLTMAREGDDEVVLCLDTADGRELWRFRYPCPYTNQQGSGPRATPTVYDDLVYTVGATGILHCLKLASGEKVWRHDLLPEFNSPGMEYGVSFSPLIEGDLVYTNPGGPGGNSLAAFDRRTGKLAWKALDDPGGYSSPIAVTAAGVRQVVFFTGTRLVGVDPADGREYWGFPWETSAHSNIATPIAVGDYLFISSSYGKGCALLKVVRDQEGGLRVQNVYANRQMRNHFSTCVYHGEHLFGFNDNVLTCLELRTGQARWSARGFGKGSLLIADGHLVILGEDGKLALAEATPEALRKKASFQALDQKCWTVPVLAHGRLYVRAEGQLHCFDVKQP